MTMAARHLSASGDPVTPAVALQAVPSPARALRELERILDTPRTVNRGNKDA
ncbi:MULTISPECIES: hypothetical protein [Streptomyces]|uniref:FXSXX-COOH protein n=1 Tax=Streptomyces galilaeus TaxID=33899 RepID=A0ABW9IKW1_STRGJ